MFAEHVTEYPVLHRMEREKLLTSSWQQADGRRRKYYRLTAAGKKELASRRQEWEQFSLSVNRVLGVQRGMA